MWKCSIGAAILGLFLTAASWAQDAAPRLQVDRLFAAWDRQDTPGCVVLVRQDGATLYQRAFGMANLELGVPLSLSSVFLLASVSKQFVVYCILLLAQAGGLSLDDDVRKHLPEVPDVGKAITIRHLIHHTSGLREDLTCFNLAGWRSGDVITRADFLRFVKNQQELNFEPGQQYLYCNTGYHLLALIAERVSRQPLAVFANEQIFRPLDMQSTRVRDNHRSLITNLAVPYAARSDRNHEFQLARVAHDPPGASNVHSTVHDLARWDQHFYDATGAGRKLLDAMQVPARLNSGKESKYAGGLVIDRYRGLKTVSHTGSHGGYKTVLLRFPEQRFSVIILANLREMVPLRLAKRVADIYLRDRLEPQTLPEEIDVSTERLAGYPGEYRIGYSLWRVRQGPRGLYVQVDGGEKKALIPCGQTSYFDREDGTRYQFVRKDDAMKLETTAESVHSSGQRLRPLEPAPEQLRAWVGTYRCAELGAISSIEMRDGQLILQLPKGEASLQFLDTDRCLARAQDAFFSMLELQLTRDRAGAVSGLTLSTERVRRLRYAKVRIE